MGDGHEAQPWWRPLLDAQRRTGFQGLAGSEGTLQLTLSDALLNELIAARLPVTWPIAELSLRALERDEIAVRARPRTAWLPPVKATLTLEQHPITAAAPLLRARFTSSLGRLATMALGAAPLPSWVRWSDDYVTVDLQALAAQHGAADLLPLVKMLTISTEPGRIILTAVLAVHSSA